MYYIEAYKALKAYVRGCDKDYMDTYMRNE